MFLQLSQVADGLYEGAILFEVDEQQLGAYRRLQSGRPKPSPPERQDDISTQTKRWTALVRGPKAADNSLPAWLPSAAELLAFHNHRLPVGHGF